ncbi:hypothetical protein ACQ33O_06615 [Ferruginibacter sp. SUN002]|uniref:hypothetical protein n=1 Tax=Ferruginibacter sp. SUN002 TaxID=2937789 RepID=UPI003D35D436
MPLTSMPTLKGNENAGEQSGTDFIELNDGRIVMGTITQFSLGDVLAKRRGSVLVDGKKYWYKEVAAAQYLNKYYRKDTKNGFDERIVKGKINVYRFLEITNEDAKGDVVKSVFDWYFLQKGDKSPVVEFEIKVLEQMIADHKPAVDEMKKYNALSKHDKASKGDRYLNNVISIYNNQ